MSILLYVISLGITQESNLNTRINKMYRKIDISLHNVANDFSNHTWIHSYIRDTYISMKPRAGFNTINGGILMWGIILLGYYLYLMPLILSVPIATMSMCLYRYFDLSFFQDRDHIFFNIHHDSIFCAGASGYERKRIKRICRKYDVDVTFYKSNEFQIDLPLRRHYYRYYT